METHRMLKGGSRTCCSAINCSNSKKSHPNLSFFRFPKDPKRCKEWQVLCRRADLMSKDPIYLYKNCKICGQHFEERMFLNDLQNRLQDEAKPTLFDVPNPPARVGTTRRKLKRHLQQPESADPDTKRQCSDLFESCTSPANDNSHQVPSEPATSTSLGTVQHDIATQTGPRLSAGTPRKQRQGKIIKEQRRKIRSLMNKVSSQKDLSLSNQNSEDVSLNKALEALPPNIAKFLTAQLKLAKSKKKGRRYDKELKSLSLALYHASGKAYRLLSSIFILPSKTSLQRMISKMSSEPGITEHALALIATKVTQMNERDKICTLCLDEVSLKANLSYNITSDEICGLEDYGNNIRTNLVASSALVLLARSISGKWKQPIGYYLVNKSCNSNRIKDILEMGILKLKEIGLRVIVIITDMGSNFEKLTKELHISPERPYFTVGHETYYYLFDPPHLLKSIRNNLLKYEFHSNRHVAKWSDIMEFYKKDKKQSIRAAPKLTDNHMEPTAFQKMKVKYATQVISHTVAASINMLVTLGGLTPSALGTADIVSKFDTIFDCFNSSQLFCTKEYRCAISHKTKHLSFLEQAADFIDTLVIIDPTNNKDVTERLKCLRGWKISINSLMLLWKILNERYSFQHLMTRRLNQDPLENFFGTIRNQGGNSDNPTPVQFSRAFKKLFHTSFLNPVSTNCAQDLDHILVDPELHKRPNLHNDIVPVIAPSRTLKIGPTDYQQHGVQENLIKESAISYVAGYILSKCYKNHKCTDCTSALSTTELGDKRNFLVYNKAFNNKKGLFGGLCAPSSKFIDYIIKLENLFVRQFTVFKKEKGIGMHLLSNIQGVEFNNPCNDFPSLYMQKLFLRMRIHYALKFANRDLVSRKRKDRKYIKIAHL